MTNRLILSLIVAFTLCGCMMGKDYKRPAVKSPETWRIQEKEAKQAANTAWWEKFDDPALNGLIQTALKENKDILIAAQRIEEYLGRYGVTRADLFPQVSASGSAGQQRMTQESHQPIPSALSPTFDNYQAAINVNWEIDLWGKLRRATEAAKADLLSTEEARRAVILTLATSVANTYVAVLNLDQQLTIAQRTVKSRKESLDLFELRYAGGVISEMELSQVKSEYEQARALIPLLEKSIAQQENALNLLMGRNPGPITRGKTMVQLTLPAVPAGLPSELLERRPDIRQAEQDLIAANARIGVAKAAYFPSISLTGLLGYASQDLSRLFMGSAGVWNYAGNLTQPIFLGGRIKGQVKAAKAMQQQALLRYQQAIQTAFREVEDALVDQRKSGEKLAAEAKQVEALRNYRSLAWLRFENGYSSYLEVLDADRTLFSAELTYTQTRGSRFQAMVNIYKAMGGGWPVESENKTAPQTGTKPYN
jgi:outer membrane protein, multidrug efflux system